MLSGGEIPALALLDAVARLQPGVLGDVRSHEQDSFSAGLLDCPHYSRPEVLAEGGEGAAVPPVLLSGNHAAIERWRRDQALALTAGAAPISSPRPRPKGGSAPPTAPASREPRRQSYNFGFSDPLPRRGPSRPTHFKSVRTIA